MCTIQEVYFLREFLIFFLFTLIHTLLYFIVEVLLYLQEWGRLVEST